VYDTATQTVTLTTRQRLTLRGFFRLTVNGAGPGGLAGADGTPLDGAGTGKPGSNYVALVHRRGVVTPATRHPSGPAAHVKAGAARPRGRP
jgi:hypothetical protein